MYRWNAKIGLLLYPTSESNTKPIRKHHILETDGCIIKVGFPIPKIEGTFSCFSEAMKKNEMRYIRQLQEFL